jgi:hypothetical protein
MVHVLRQLASLSKCPVQSAAKNRPISTVNPKRAQTTNATLMSANATMTPVRCLPNQDKTRVNRARIAVVTPESPFMNR